MGDSMQTDKIRNDARQESLAELGEIASRMAHEIRNPLNAIRMQVAVIRNKLLKPDLQNLEVAKGQLERLEMEVLRVEKLARAFLEFGRPPLDQPEPIDLDLLVRDVAGLVGPEFEESGHSLQIESDAGPMVVYMDRAKLRQVLLNLLTNARNAMDSPGEVRITLARHDDGHACIRVEDTGCGIAASELSSIFLPFHHGRGSGEGLGLPIARKIVEAVGGCIRVHSTLGRGSSFEVLLPRTSPGSPAESAR